jgi:hypothetical protein
LRRRITAAIAMVPVDVLSRVWGEVQGRQWCSYWIVLNDSKTWRDCL